MNELAHVLGAGPFYVQAGTVPGKDASYVPHGLPVDWRNTVSGIWRQWHPGGGADIEAQGWKVHISARADRARHVLDIAAPLCAEHGVVFKHLATPLDFVVMHHKHASRRQAGKFIAAYPGDPRTALCLMRDLKEALAGEEGPYVLTDRAFEGSACVYYRYGAFTSQGRVRPDGSFSGTVIDAHGDTVEDERGIGCGLPPGITDPFQEPVASRAPRAGEVSVGGCTIERVVRFSNSGGTYQGVQQSTGRRVFLKEARPHVGLVSTESDARQRLHSEFQALTALHALHPGLCPEPLDYFTEGGHDFLVTEFVDGESLHAWTVRNNPIVNSTATAAEFERYFAACEKLIDALRDDLRRLHAAGHAFIDLGPDNVLVQEGGVPRLVDFETVGPVGRLPALIGAAGFFDPDLARTRPLAQDEHALSSVALYLLAPIQVTADRNPAVLGHLRALLERVSPPPKALWDQVLRRSAPLLVSPPTPAVSPERPASAPAPQLHALRDDLVRGILSAADPENGGTLFPTVPEGFATNTLAIRHGSAGVLYALQRSGVEVPDAILARFTRDAVASRTVLPPGLFSGTAGLSWVLADAGRLDEAAALLRLAVDHPVLRDCPDFAHGRAGVAMACLRLHAATRECRYAEWAAELLAPSRDETPGDLATTGLATGPAGVAMALYYLYRLTGDEPARVRGRRLLARDLGRGTYDHGGLLFPVSATDRRLMPYLWSGSAGIGMVVERYRSLGDDEELCDAAAGIRTAASCLFTRAGGLFQGLAGLGTHWSDAARRSADESARAMAQDVATRLFVHLVPTEDGTYLHGDPGVRLSCDLGSGSAGVLLFLDHLLRGTADPLFTLDAHVERRPVPAPALPSDFPG
ncbi:serine/threonine protein kinase [Streptomyces kronopolitis]|uniref:Serine/threonine protein kinase n=1 Tax=Streptomyces kronopolitis TaxID=1612435 RepID=A0ABQ2J0C1_9ACTN|nr:serine/threonine protein kinase [Streptomyces kronopolitis]